MCLRVQGDWNIAQIMMDDTSYVNAFADRGNWDQGTATAVLACVQGSQVVRPVSLSHLHSLRARVFVHVISTINRNAFH